MTMMTLMVVIMMVVVVVVVVVMAIFNNNDDDEDYGCIKTAFADHIVGKVRFTIYVRLYSCT